MNIREIIKQAKEYWNDQEYECALPLIRELAEEGEFFGVYHLALCSLSGLATKKDPERAKRLAIRALKIAEEEQSDENRELALILLAEIDSQQPKNDTPEQDDNTTLMPEKSDADEAAPLMLEEEILYPEEWTSLPAIRRELLAQYEEAMRLMYVGEKERAVVELERLSELSLAEADAALALYYPSDIDDNRLRLLHLVRAATLGRADAEMLAKEFERAYYVFCLERRNAYKNNCPYEINYLKSHYWLDVCYWAKEYYLQQKAKGFSDVDPAPEYMEEVRRLFDQQQYDRMTELLRTKELCGEAYYYISICQQNGLGRYKISDYSSSFFSAVYAAMYGYAPAYQYLAYKFLHPPYEFDTNHHLAAFWFKEAIEATGSTPSLEKMLSQSQENRERERKEFCDELSRYNTVDTSIWESISELSEYLGNRLKTIKKLIYGGNRKDLDLAYDSLSKLTFDFCGIYEDGITEEIRLLKYIGAKSGGEKFLQDDPIEYMLIDSGDCDQLLEWFKTVLVNVKNKETRKEILQKIEVIKAERDETVDPERLSVYYELSVWQGICCCAYYRYALAGVKEGLNALGRYYFDHDREKGVYWSSLAGESGFGESCMNLVRYYTGIGYDLVKAEYWARKTIECDEERKPDAVEALEWIGFMRRYREEYHLSFTEEGKEYGIEDLEKGRKLLKEELNLEALEPLLRAYKAGNLSAIPDIISACACLRVFADAHEERRDIIRQLRNALLMIGYLDYAAVDYNANAYIMYILGNPAYKDYFEENKKAFSETARSIKTRDGAAAARNAGNIDAFCRSAVSKQPDIEEIKMAAMMGHSYALYWLGDYYNDKNRSVADRCYIESARRGYGKAIAYCDLHGLDITV